MLNGCWTLKFIFYFKFFLFYCGIFSRLATRLNKIQKSGVLLVCVRQTGKFSGVWLWGGEVKVILLGENKFVFSISWVSNTVNTYINSNPIRPFRLSHVFRSSSSLLSLLLLFFVYVFLFLFLFFCSPFNLRIKPILPISKCICATKMNPKNKNLVAVKYKYASEISNGLLFTFSRMEWNRMKEMNTHRGHKDKN